MKRSFQPKLIVVAVFILLAIAVIVTNSCRKDVHNTNNGTISSNSIIDTSVVTQAKKWYQAVYPENSSTKIATQSIGDSPAQHWDQVLTPYWAKAQTFIQDSLLIIEIPALKKGDLAFSNKQVSANSFDFTRSPSVTSILIVVANGHIGAYAMTIMGDSSYIANNYNKLSNNTYRKKDNNFSGYVFYHEFDGTFVNGWRYVNGKVTGAINQQQTNAATNPSQGIQSIKKVNVEEAPPTNCYEDVTEYWEVCTYWENDTFDQHPISCSYYTTDNIYSIPCPGTSTGGGSSSDGNISPPPPQKCQPPNVTEQSINGRLKIDVAPPPPGSGSGTGNTNPTTTVTSQQACPNDNGDVLDSLKNYPCAQQLVAKIASLKDSIANLINKTFGNNNDLNLIYRADTTGFTNSLEDGFVDPNYDNTTISTNPKTGAKSVLGNIVITLNGNMLRTATQDYILVTMYHEAIHAYLNVMQNQLTPAQFQQQFPGVTTVTTTDANGNTATYPVLPAHTQMATTFVTDLTNALLSFDPNLPPDVAKDLAEGGIINDPSIIPANLAERGTTSAAKGIKCNP